MNHKVEHFLAAEYLNISVFVNKKAYFHLGGLALCLRGSTEERGHIIFDMV